MFFVSCARASECRRRETTRFPQRRTYGIARSTTRTSRPDHDGSTRWLTPTGLRYRQRTESERNEAQNEQRKCLFIYFFFFSQKNKTFLPRARASRDDISVGARRGIMSRDRSGKPVRRRNREFRRRSVGVSNLDPGRGDLAPRRPEPVKAPRTSCETCVRK